jgi:hypothetical protein
VAKKHGSGRGPQLNKGPFTGPQIADALTAQGYVRKPGGRHLNFEHPSRSGKVSISESWTGIKAGSEMFRSLMRQTGYGKTELLRILNGLSPTTGEELVSSEPVPERPPAQS